jgi:RNA polymerase sigma factor (sigma-70 family)
MKQLFKDTHQPAVSDRVGNGDRELLVRISAGEVRALAELYDRYAPDVWRAAQSALRNAEDVEDVVYETFLRVVPRLAEKYDGGASCRTWLRDLAIRQAQRYDCRARRFLRALRAMVRIPSGRRRISEEMT